jgi:SAM-dependent methyltransferase
VKVTGIDLSQPLLAAAQRAAASAERDVRFVPGDMREMPFQGEFDAVYCYFSTFGYFDDEGNRRAAAEMAKALRPGGRMLLDLLNRDHVIAQLPTRIWWEGHGCMVLEEVDFNYFTSRLQSHRSMVFEDGRQTERDLSIRAYSLHEIGQVLHQAGFRITEVSGGASLRGRFFGGESQQMLILAEKK